MLGNTAGAEDEGLRLINVVNYPPLDPFSFMVNGRQDLVIFFFQFCFLMIQRIMIFIYMITDVLKA